LGLVLSAGCRSFREGTLLCVWVLFLPVYRSDLWWSSITTEPSINRFNCHIDQSKFASSLPRPKTSRLLVVRTGQTWIRCVGVSSDSGSLQSLQMAGRPAWGLIFWFWCLRRKQWPVMNWTSEPIVFLLHLPSNGAILFVLIVLKKSRVSVE
jgi:hypothetical protein